MCQLFINADSRLWTCRTKSLRIDGVVTSIRLEEFFWDILEEVAFRDQMTVNQMITKLYLESLDADHDIGNFTSFLRVCCSRYLSLVADGNLTREDAIPLNDIDATQVLEQEKLRTSVRKSQYIDTSLKSSLN
ncbi:ribbon-helix-helix domain-containing protein [Pseudoalteromonas sp. SR44-5]|uniref:ribbon-helix-helix domain-containing protein n=1 Tax=Pseudoalteromonas TaxID=53246 RepID=UPI0012303D7F|nr:MULTISPECIES: ribbon-helix-helix domain-containing protein [Pseudoalteromonas]MBB1343273.1 ribbon-helix-helix domain-containing protein [Pseudoalteromonas sp. SR45-6]MBB1368093.1 ribbon-helix-helix domain-containing protein [Pseudoalteromonas sp. SR44-5]MBB1418858.1 ribbon-helix-helix domain-containing protein [Pseudoalteromonas sp. SG44-1]MBB1423266.1 ribbon-helix-helix domain-containing protein [Pseudoalteromonas sp. SG43-7]MBB1435102.1 ribbon-helix-helix domain-containing protein [Pseudo